jgi:hypothetical protein
MNIEIVRVTKDDKDISDFFLKHNLIAEDLYKKIEEAIPYSEDDFIEAKEAEYPLVPLWEIINPEYSNRYISSRVIMMGKYDRPMETPTAIKWACTSPKFGDGILRALRSFADGSPVNASRGAGHHYPAVFKAFY